jgi:hypothetical protein
MYRPAMVMYTYNPSTPEAEAGEWQVRNQSGLHSEFQPGYIPRPCLKKSAGYDDTHL